MSVPGNGNEEIVMIGSRGSLKDQPCVSDAARIQTSTLPEMLGC